MKMRKKIALGLCVFYLVSVIGIAMSLHFCGDNLSSVKFTEQAACSSCKVMNGKEMAKNDNCCKNETVKAKITDQHQSSDKLDLPKNYSITLFLTPIIANFIQSLLPGFFNQVESKASPLSSRISLHIMNCIFRN
jgi:hypothetical protein